MTDNLTGFLISWLILFAAGHLWFGPRWAIDGTRDLAAVYVRLWRSVRALTARRLG